MLTSSDHELILLAVDGECTPAQWAAVRELLANSSAAMRCYQDYTAQRQIIAAQRLGMPRSVAGSVMAHLGVPSSVTKTAKPARDWLPYVMAFSLFISVALGAFWLTMVTEQGPTRSDQPLAKHLPKQKPSTNDLTRPQLASHQTTTTRMELEEAPVPRRPVDIMAKVDSSLAPELAPTPRSGSADVVASAPESELAPLTNVQLRLPWLVEAVEFHKPEMQTKLSHELTKASAFRIDLLTHDLHRSLELLQSTTQRIQIKLMIETLAQERIQKQLPGSYAIYCESLTAEELSQWLIAAMTSTKSTGQAGQATSFQALHVIPATPQDANEVRALLGSDLGFLKRTANLNSGSRSISSGTIDQLTNSLRGSSSREKPALMVNSSPTASRVSPFTSKTIKSYLDTRGERRPKSVPVLIVIR